MYNSHTVITQLYMTMVLIIIAERFGTNRMSVAFSGMILGQGEVDGDEWGLTELWHWSILEP